VRHLFVTNEVLQAADPSTWSSRRLARRHQLLRADLDRFTEGELITVGVNPRDKDATANLARVEPLTAEVWDIRCCDPKPGIRVLGRFAEKDTFIAVCWDYRENLRRDKDWTAFVDRCLQEWPRLMNMQAAYRGPNLNAYLTNFLAV